MSQSSDSTPLQKLLHLPGFLVRFTVWKLGFCRRLRKYDPVLVLQMAKVGSKSVTASLSGVYRGEVIHVHYLSENNPDGKVREFLRYCLGESPPERIRVITPIRDPFDRNLSLFFHNFEKYTGHHPAECGLGMSELHRIFIENFDHMQPLTWINRAIEDYFELDVFGKPFPDRGWDTYSNDRVDLLIFRCEIDDEEKNRAVNAFMGMEKFRIRNQNQTQQRRRGKLYGEFKESIRLPADLVNTICDSDYFNHFYDRETVEAARRRWSVGQENGSHKEP